MSKELPKAYTPGEYEDEIYKKWEESGFFNPDNLPDRDEESPNFTISMPPPNVTGVLHLGHALENTIMDSMLRYQRMRGKKALLVPGTDHSAVATQARVEKNLIKEGKYKHPREELGREKLLEIIREYAENSKETILKQIRKMGTSCDWSRLAYTFDEPRSKAVNEIFMRMYNDGLIYRGYRVINWSIKGQSTCSDDELVHVERQAKLYTFKYSKDFPIMIATTRPETKLGDTAVAVNPEDIRYKQYIGQTFVVDVGANKPLKIKIIADKEVDPEFGTGAVGVTPAHSPVDYEMHLRHDLELIPVIDQYGCMTYAAGENYKGLKAEAAREKFVDWLTKNDLLEKVEDISQNVGTSDRFGDIVEAIPMTQWFVAVNKKIPSKNKSLKELMKEAVSEGHNGDPKKKIKITPERFEKTYFNWIDNLRDWCISRQIWWGHRIPVWYKKSTDQRDNKSINQNDKEIKAQVESPGEAWEQDPDTLDTWFSSGLWTFSVLGWPNKTEELRNFHPNTWMQMGYEILFFWMARMILMSTYALDEIPFKDVYIHGMLRDQKGQKFSKSLGNGGDPIEVCDKFGTDAFRMSLITSNTPGNDSKFYEDKVRGFRNFINKFWNVGRFIQFQQEQNSFEQAEGSGPRTLADKWVTSRMNNLIQDVTEYLENFQFSLAGEKLYNFTWHELADWYVEIAKVQNNQNTYSLLLNTYGLLLKLLHPFIPFVTEKIWEYFGSDIMLMIEKWPNSDESQINQQAEQDFSFIKELIIGIRSWRKENGKEPKEILKIQIGAGLSDGKLVEEQKDIVEKLTKVELEIVERLSQDKDFEVGNVKVKFL